MSAQDKKLRIVKWLVQPVAFVDDGETLVEVPLEPLSVPAGNWQHFREVGHEEAVAGLRAKLGCTDDATPEPEQPA